MPAMRGQAQRKQGHTKELCRPYGANHSFTLFHGGLCAPPMLCRPYGANHSFTLFHGGLRAPPMLCRPYGLIITIHYALYTMHYK